MHSILRNLAQKHSSSLNILEYSSIFPKISKCAFQRPLTIKHLKYSTISSEEYVTKINKHYSWLDIPKNKTSLSSLTKISYRTNQRFRRFFCQNTTKKSERDIKRRQLDKNDQLKRDDIYAEDCITAREEKCKKKHIKRRGDIKFTVNLNNIINEMNKKKNLEKQHEINKINNFIFKPIDCKSCSQKRRSSSKKCNHVNHQKRTNSSYSATKKNYPRYEKKQERFQRQLYDEATTYKPRIELLAFLNNKNEEGALLVKSKTNFTNLRSKSTVPLFLLVKCNSTKSKTMNNFTRNVKYKVGTNQALIKVYSKTKKSDKNSISLENQYRFVNNYKDTENQLVNFDSIVNRPEKNNQGANFDSIFNRADKNNQVANFDSIFNRTEKSKGKKLQFYQYQPESKSQAPKPVLAKAIYEMLRPLIEQEYLQYKEVKEAIERLERNLQHHFNRSKNEGSECQVYKSLSNINHLRTRQSQLNLPDKKHNEINDPKMDLEIIDPLDTDNRKEDPSTNSPISVPCIKKEKIFDPIEYEITIIAKDCFDKNKKNSGCDGKNGSQEEKKDPCKKETKKEPCKKEKDDDPCKKEKDDDPCKKVNDGKKKEDPCKEMKRGSRKCSQNKGKDLCSKNIEDLCKDKQKHDHCKDKNPPTSKKQSGPCDKKDTCKKSSDIKDDDCFKLESLKNKQRASDSNDHSCMKPKKKVENFVATPNSCDGNEKAIRKDICKKSDQSCKNNKVDPCKSFKERSKLTSKDQCGEIGIKKEDPCKRLKEVTKYKETEQKKNKGDYMKPSEVTCKKDNSIKPRPCCEQVSVCEEPKLPVIKPTCSEEKPKKNCIETTEKTPDHCKKVPMPMDCPMKIDAEGKSQHGESVSCKQKSCSQKSMEPTEPPNCCKPRPKSVGGECSRTFEGQQIVQEKPEIRQISCQELIKQQEKSAALSKAPPFPKPPKSSQSKKERPKCPPPSKSDTRYCTKSTKKEVEYVPEQAEPARIKPKISCDENILRKPYPDSREPRQAAKDSWKPVKIKGKNSTPKCQLRHAKSSPCTKMQNASDTSPKLTSDKPKEECSQKSFLESCKGIFSSVYSILCPGKNKKSGKKAASLGLIRSISLPEIRGLTGGTLSGSSGNNYRKKKPGTMCFAHYKTKDRYPWRNTNRWILRNERFFSKSPKKSDVCSTKNEEVSPEANKLNCICYEEMKKSGRRDVKNQSGADNTCVKMGDTDNQKEPTKRLNFKLTDHSKICQAANKTKANSKNGKCKSHSNIKDQSIFNQCGELSKQRESGNVQVEIPQTDNSTGKSTNEQSCINKLNTNPEAKGKEKAIERKQEQQKACTDKLKINDKTMKKEGSAYEEEVKACLDKLKSRKEKSGKQKESLVNCQSIKTTSSSSGSKSNTSVKNKYPWQKSEEKMDAELCPNQSAITAGSSENAFSKPKTGEFEKNIKEKNKDEKKKYSLEVEKDSSCFKGQGIKRKSDTDKDKDICKKIDQKQAPASGDSHRQENTCAKLNTKEAKKEQEKDGKCVKNNEEANQENQNKKKRYILNIKKDPCCFKRQEKQSQSDVDKQKDQSKNDIKCPNTDDEVKRKKQKYSLDSHRESSCFKNQGTKNEPNDQANKADKRNICDRTSSTQNEKETASEKECCNYNKECKNANSKNFLENYNKKVENILASGENAKNENKQAGKITEEICSKIMQKQSAEQKTNDKGGEQKTVCGKGKDAGKSTEDICSKIMQKQNAEQKTNDKGGEQNTACGKGKDAGKSTEDICSKIMQKQSAEQKTNDKGRRSSRECLDVSPTTRVGESLIHSRDERRPNNPQNRHVSNDGRGSLSQGDEQKTVCGKGKDAGKSTEDICSKIMQKQGAEEKTNDKGGEQSTVCGKGKDAGKSTEDICSKILQKQNAEEKTKLEDGKNKCQKQVTQSSTRQKNSMNLNGFLSNENEEDLFICKVKKLGKSEQFICNPKGEECNTSNKQEKGVVRVLKCKLTKDDCGRDVFVCKEIKPKAAENRSSEDEELRMKRLLKPRNSPELPSKKMSISKKLVCTQETRDENNEAKKEMVCDIREVREIIEENEIKKYSCENSNKKSPFTYKDLLKRSEEIRKKGNAECLKRDKTEKRKDCKDKLRT